MKSIRTMEAADWTAVSRIYSEGIAGRNATFETVLPPYSVWDEKHLKEPRLVAEIEEEVLGFAALSPVSSRACYAGVTEVSLYIAGAAQGQGVGKGLLEALIEAAESCGIWTLQGTIFSSNEASISLHKRCGFREVGRRERIAQLDGLWRDTVLLERRSQRVG